MHQVDHDIFIVPNLRRPRPLSFHTAALEVRYDTCGYSFDHTSSATTFSYNVGELDLLTYQVLKCVDRVSRQVITCVAMGSGTSGTS